jgi:hypothetical protein
MAEGKAMQLKALQCPSCAAPLQIRTPGHALTVVCSSCLTAVDPRDDYLTILNEAEKNKKIKPTIPLGKKGKLFNETWQVIGFIQRGTMDGDFKWLEYLLFNPWKGYRWLTEDNRHWSFVAPISGTLKEEKSFKRFLVKQGATRYDLYNQGRVKVFYTEGEFYWRVRVGDSTMASDYIAPPEMLCSEIDAGEAIWSKGIYVEASLIQKAFDLQGIKKPISTGMLQPNHHHKSLKVARKFMFLAVLTVIVMQSFAASRSRNAVLFADDGIHTSEKTSMVTRPFEINGPTSNLILEIETDLSNNWLEVSGDLVNEANGESYPFSKAIEYYWGTDSDGPWREGSTSAKIEFDAIPSGTYHVSVETSADLMTSLSSINYRISGLRDVPEYTWFFITLTILCIPVFFFYFMHYNFEAQRWMNSDFSPYASE